MELLKSLNMESTRTLAKIRRDLQSEISVSFKLSNQDDVLKMLRYANLSEIGDVTACLDVFLMELPEAERSALAVKGITGTLPAEALGIDSGKDDSPKGLTHAGA
jgi:hypothetical protein